MDKEIKKENSDTKPKSTSPVKKVETKKSGEGSVYAQKKAKFKKRRRPGGKRESGDEFDQRIIDIARVTRVMAGGKRMRFRACVAIGDKKGRVAVGLSKGADVTIAVTKAVNDAKKKFIEISIVNDTIPHEIFQKYGAAKVLLRPARQGKGVIAGGAVRVVLELAGIKNITSKNLGTNNKVNIAKCTILALDNLKKVEVRNKNKSVETKDKKIATKKIEKNDKKIK